MTAVPLSRPFERVTSHRAGKAMTLVQLCLAAAVLVLAQGALAAVAFHLVLRGPHPAAGLPILVAAAFFRSDVGLCQSGTLSEPVLLACVPQVCHSGTMDLTPYVSNLGREFATLAEAGGAEARALVERLTGPLESAIRMTLLEALSAAAGEITRDLAPGSVELRLRGRDPDFVVAVPPGVPFEHSAEDAATMVAGVPGGDLLLTEDGPAARINVRMPEQLKAAIEEAAVREGRSVNAWLARAAAAALPRSNPDQRPEPPAVGKRSKQGFTGWVR